MIEHRSPSRADLERALQDALRAGDYGLSDEIGQEYWRKARRFAGLDKEGPTGPATVGHDLPSLQGESCVGNPPPCAASPSTISAPLARQAVPGDCEGSCNPYVTAVCGARFCSYDEMAEHVRTYHADTPTGGSDEVRNGGSDSAVPGDRCDDRNARAEAPEADLQPAQPVGGSDDTHPSLSRETEAGTGHAVDLSQAGDGGIPAPGQSRVSMAPSLADVDVTSPVLAPEPVTGETLRAMCPVMSSACGACLLCRVADQLDALTRSQREAEQTIATLMAQIVTLTARVYVPHQWQCSVCGFVVSKMLLRASDGAVGIDTREMQDICPNDGTSLQRVTWEDAAEDHGNMAQQQLDRALKAEAERDIAIAHTIDQVEVGVKGLTRYWTNIDNEIVAAPDQFTGSWLRRIDVLQKIVALKEKTC